MSSLSEVVEYIAREAVFQKYVQKMNYDPLIKHALEAVSSGYPNPTRYPVFHLLPDPTRFSFENHRVAGNPKYRVLPEISGKPGVSGITRYIG